MSIERICRDSARQRPSDSAQPSGGVHLIGRNARLYVRFKTTFTGRCVFLSNTNFEFCTRNRFRWQGPIESVSGTLIRQGQIDSVSVPLDRHTSIERTRKENGGHAIYGEN